MNDNQMNEVNAKKSNKPFPFKKCLIWGFIFTIAIVIFVSCLPKCELCGTTKGVTNHLGSNLCSSCWNSIQNDTKNYTSSSYSSYSSFTNKFGTPKTRCAHSGCTNFIASSGDTNCCTQHSNRCLECNKYIDEDALWCVDCIKKAAGY